MTCAACDFAPLGTCTSATISAQCVWRNPSKLWVVAHRRKYSKIPIRCQKQLRERERERECIDVCCSVFKGDFTYAS